jgi:hypothetical protein
MDGIWMFMRSFSRGGKKSVCPVHEPLQAVMKINGNAAGLSHAGTYRLRRQQPGVGRWQPGEAGGLRATAPIGGIFILA